MKKVYIIGLFVCFTSTAVFADLFGLVSKSLDDHNFVDAWLGCQKAAIDNNDQCVHLGVKGSAHVRTQKIVIQEALESGRFQSLAISVTKSDYIADALQGVEIPIITFDSPFEINEQHLSLSYVGIDNIAFGKELAKLAKKFRPAGGTVCIMTARHDTNLAQRVLGVRRELSGLELKDGLRLNGENAWYEEERCPWKTADNPARSLKQLDLTLNKLKPDVIISVGHWPIVDPVDYRNVVEPYRKELKTNKHVIAIATGNLLPEYKALIDEGLLQGVVSINFPEIGRVSYELMKAASSGKPIPPLKYIDNSTYSVKD